MAMQAGRLARREPDASAPDHTDGRVRRGHRRGHCPARRQEDRPRKPRDPVLHHVPRTRPQAILAATRAQWGIEIFHWTLDVTFDEDRCRTRKDASPLNFAVIQHTGYNLLSAGKTRGSIRRKRLRACIDPEFRTKLFAA